MRVRPLQQKHTGIGERAAAAGTPAPTEGAWSSSTPIGRIAGDYGRFYVRFDRPLDRVAKAPIDLGERVRRMVQVQNCASAPGAPRGKTHGEPRLCAYLHARPHRAVYSGDHVELDFDGSQ